MPSPFVDDNQEELVLAFLAEADDDFISGEVLSGKLGLTRAAVYRYVESLRAKGYRIDAQPARGYRLAEVPDRLTALEVLPLLSTAEIGRQIHHHDVIGSTNEVAYQLATQGAAHGEVVIAETQTQGKGRRGRSWVSPAGKNLYCSLVLRPDLPTTRAPELTLVAAVALADTLQEAGVLARIKWPNDIQLDGRKVAGILTELSIEGDRVSFVIVGVGVNLNCADSDFPPEVREIATSVAMARNEKVPRALFTAAFFTRFENWLQQYLDQGFEPVRQAWKNASSTLGQEVMVKTDRTEIKGVAEDINESGALLVRTSDGSVETVMAGDVEQLKPKQTPRNRSR